MISKRFLILLNQNNSISSFWFYRADRLGIRVVCVFIDQAKIFPFFVIFDQHPNNANLERLYWAHGGNPDSRI